MQFSYWIKQQELLNQQQKVDRRVEQRSQLVAHRRELFAKILADDLSLDAIHDDAGRIHMNLRYLTLAQAAGKFVDQEEHLDAEKDNERIIRSYNEALNALVIDLNTSAHFFRPEFQGAVNDFIDSSSKEKGLWYMNDEMVDFELKIKKILSRSMTSEEYASAATSLINSEIKDVSLIPFDHYIYPVLEIMRVQMAEDDGVDKSIGN